MREIKLFSYVVKTDLGLAPNPFWGLLTLNVCKPRIREYAHVGDWIIGIGAKNIKKDMEVPPITIQESWFTP